MRAKDTTKFLTTAEIRQMREELADVTTPPPKGRMHWSVFRIVATLEHLLAEVARLSADVEHLRETRKRKP